MMLRTSSPLLLGALALLAACERRLDGSDTADSDGSANTDRPPVEGDLNDDESGDTSGPIDTGGDTGEDTSEPIPTDAEACYAGEAGSLCLPLVAPDDPGPAYDYPAPLQGSANYRAPVAYLDLSAHDPATRLAPNFRLDEFAQEGKGRYGVVQPHLIEYVQALRDDLGPINVNSGYRSPGYNAGVDGSATYSRHTYGDAADMAAPSVSLATLRQACLDHGAGYVGTYTTHIHCDWRDDAVDEAFFGPAGRAVPTWADLPLHDAWVERDGERLVAPTHGWDEGEPLREWYAYDADGVLLDVAIAESFVPPAETMEVVVVVGRDLTRTVSFHEL